MHENFGMEGIRFSQAGMKSFAAIHGGGKLRR